MNSLIFAPLVDEALWTFLENDLLEAEAADPLPGPPRLPRLEALTVRPGRPS